MSLQAQSQHRRRMKPQGKVKSVLERKHSMSFTTIATAVGISPASTYSIFTNSLTKGPCVFLPPPICSVGENKAVHFWIVFKRLTSNGCTHLTLSLNDKMLKGVPKRHRERKLNCIVTLLWKSCTSYSSAAIDICLKIPCQLIRWWVINVTAHSWKRLWRLFDIKKT